MTNNFKTLVLSLCAALTASAAWAVSPVEEGTSNKKQSVELAGKHTKKQVDLKSDARVSFYEGFEGCDGNYYHAWLPSGWQNVSLAGHVHTTPETWLTNVDVTWQTGSTTTFGGAPYKGSFMAYCPVSYAYGSGDNYHPQEYQDEWLWMPAVTPEEKDYLYFYLCYSPGWVLWNKETGTYDGQNTILEVQASTDNGEHWAKIWDCLDMAKAHTVAELDADRTLLHRGYVPVYVDLAAYVGQSVRLAFRYVGLGGQGMLIDEVKVGAPAPEASYAIPTGVFKQGLSENMTTPEHPALLAPWGMTQVWKNTSVDALTYNWTYSDAEGLEAHSTSKDVTTPAYPRNFTCSVPALTAHFNDASDTYASGFKTIFNGGTFTEKDIDLDDKPISYGVVNYDFSAPTAAVRYNSSFVGFDANTTTTWGALTGQTYIEMSGIATRVKQPQMAYGLKRVYFNVYARVLSGGTHFTAHVYKFDDNYNVEVAEVAKVTITGNDVVELPEGYSKMVFDFTDLNLTIDYPITIEITGFDLEDEVYPAFYTVDANEAQNIDCSYMTLFGVDYYTSDWVKCYYDLGTLGLGSAGNRYITGLCMGLDVVYNWLEGDTDLDFKADVEGDEKTFTFVSGDDITIDLDDCDWANVDVDVDVDNCERTNTVKITVDAQGEDAPARSAAITVYTPGAESKVITVSQDQTGTGAVNGITSASNAAVEGVYNLSGQKVATSLESLPKGVYMIRTATGTTKVVK